jgi:hypothetical protein
MAALLVGAFQVAADGRQDSQKKSNTGEQETVTVDGCLSVNPAARTYILTVRPDNLARTGGAVSNAPTTITYQLVGGEGLQNHVGDRVEVTGQVEPDSAVTAKSESERSGPPRNTRQQTEEKPKVETKTETKIRAQVLRVKSFRFVAGNCKPTQG